MTRYWQRVAALTLAAILAAPAVQAQEGWNPFREKDELARRTRRQTEPARPPLPPMDGSYSGGQPVQPGFEGAQPGFGTAYPGSEPPPAYARSQTGPVERQPGLNASAVEKLGPEATSAATAISNGGAPSSLPDGEALAQTAWQGMDMKAVEASMGALVLPPRSEALHGAWVRLLMSPADAPPGGSPAGQFEAVRLEALYRSGLLDAMGKRLESTPPDDAVLRSFVLRRDLALGRREAACGAQRGLTAQRDALPKQLGAELALVAGYCAAAEGNPGGAGVAADLAREEKVDAPVALAALDALAGNGKGPLKPPKLVRVLDYRLLALLGAVDPAQVLDRAEPPLLAAMALDETAEPRTRVIAAEAAARIHAISATQLRAAYDVAPPGPDEPALRRAELARVIAAEAQMPRKLQLMRSLLDDARKANLLLPVAQMLAPLVSSIAPTAELAPQADTLIEVALAGGDSRRARDIASATGARHWLPLIDIAEQTPSEQSREQNLSGLEDAIRRGRFAPAVLHRLATVLDATDVNVPIPVWEAAGRTPQPTTGYLPDTGVLGDLQAASKKKEVARTILLAMLAMGPTTPAGEHIIGLGDTIRALRRAGLDRDARALGVEALLADWPRGGPS